MEIVNSDFDKFKQYKKIKRKIDKRKAASGHLLMSITDEEGNTYSRDDMNFAEGVLCFYHPRVTIEYLESQIELLPRSQREYNERIFHLCKKKRAEYHEALEEVCDQLKFNLEEVEFLIRFMPFGPYAFTILLDKYNFKGISLDDFATHISLLFIVKYKPEDDYFDDEDKESLKKEFVEIFRILDSKKDSVPFFIPYVFDKTRTYLKQWGKQFGIKVPTIKNELESAKPLKNGEFLLRWEYVTFIKGRILLYHPFHPNEYPFELIDDRSVSAFNDIKKHLSKKLPQPHVLAKNGYIDDILNDVDLNQAIDFLLERYYKENPTVILAKTRNPKEMDDESLREYIHQLKSTYLDWLCCQQIPDFKIYYIREVRTNNNLIDEDEDAFLFVIKASASSLIAIYENAKEARSSILFKIPKGQLDVKVQEIHEFFSSNAVNKRDQIARGIVKDKLFQQGKYERVLHTNFSQWQTKVLHFN